MNANELADWLIAYMVDDDDYEEKYMEQIVTMLRQQQAELDRAVELYTDKAIENEALKELLKEVS